MGLKGGAFSSKQQETSPHKSHHSTTSSSFSQHHSRANSNEQLKEPKEPEKAEEANIDFEGVQRGDAEMGNKLCRVINTCVTMGQKNPILHIFNQGAGGNSHIMKMIVECRSRASGGECDV